MIKYCKLQVNNKIQKKVFVFGCGNYGRRCTKYLENLDVTIEGYIDNNENKQKELFYDKKVFSPKVIKEKYDDVFVIIAVEKFHDILEQLQLMKFDNIALFCKNELYLCEDIQPLGIEEVNALRDLLQNREIILLGNNKHQEDFIYIFDWIKIKDRSDDYKTVLEYDADNVIISCEELDESVVNELQNKGFNWDKNLIKATDLFAILDDINILEEYPMFPSIMMQKTWDDTMKNQKICIKPFRNVTIGSRYNVHCCCSDWSIPWGNVEKDSLDDIWNSIIAKIFRLSMINRTYSFCNEARCVNLQIDVDKCDERMKPIPVVPNIPKHLEIGIDKTCNLYCKSCRNSVYVETDMERLQKVSDTIKESGWLDKVDGLLLGGQGEVFFSKVYKDIMFESDVKRKSLELRTNGILITQDYLEKLIEKYEKMQIIVSIDASTKETYDKLRRSNNANSWDMLQNNLRLLSEYRKLGKIGFFQINMCVQMLNYTEINDYVKLGMELGVDRVYITPIRNWGTYSEEEFKNIGIFESSKILKEEVRKAISDEVINNKKVLFAF